MNKIIETLKELGFTVEPLFNSRYIYAVTQTITCRIIVSHEKTEPKYTISFSTVAAFDRWSNSSAVEEIFDTEADLAAYVKGHWGEILNELIAYLSSEFEDLQRELNGDC